MVGGRDDLRSLLFRAMVGAGAIGGELYVAENMKQEIIQWLYGLAQVRPCGPRKLVICAGSSFDLTVFVSEEQRNEGYNQLMQELDENTKDWWKNTVRSNRHIGSHSY